MVLALVKRLPFHQLFVVTLVGVSSGVYIFKPMLEEYWGKRGVRTTNDVSAVSKAVKSASTSAKKKDVTGVLLIRAKGKEDKASSE